MLKTYEIRKVPCNTKPDLWKFNMECKEKINKELDISDDKSEVYFLTSDLYRENCGYVIGCRVETEMRTFYFVFEDSPYADNFIYSLKKNLKFNVENKIRKYTTITKTRKKLKTNANGDVELNKSGKPVYVTIKEESPNFSLRNLEYGILGDTSTKPVNKEDYLTVLRRVLKHYDEDIDGTFLKSLSDGEMEKYVFLLDRLRDVISQLEKND